MLPVYELSIFSSLAFGWLTWFTWRRKSKITHMQMMVSGMTLGMCIGLIAGLVLGAELKGDLYSSTVWGMLAGGLVGFIFGIPISLLCTIEGTLSGVMAGMMGAMLGEMVPISKIEPLLLIFLLLFTACILILTKMMETNEVIENRKWFFSIHNPLVPVLLLAGVFGWYQSLDFPLSTPKQEGSHANHNQSQEKINQEKGNNVQKESVDVTISLEIDAAEFSYKPNQLFIKKGVPTQLSLKNTGKVEHDLEIVADKNSFILFATENFHAHGGSEQSDKIHLHAKPGEKATSVINATRKGTYKFVCTIPGHKESGMIGTITVI